MYLFTLAFWNYAFERAVKTIAQVAVAALTASTFIPSQGDAWAAIGFTSLLAGLVSVLTSLTAYSASSKNEINVDADVESILKMLSQTAPVTAAMAEPKAIIENQAPVVEVQP